MEELFSLEFWDVVASKRREGQRKGQAIFNTAFYFWPIEARRLSDSTVDPFYQDGNIPYFLENLADLLTR
jgi:hypothetical protein